MQPLGCKFGERRGNNVYTETGKEEIIMVAGNQQEQQKLSLLKIVDIPYVICSCQRIYDNFM